MIKKVQYCFISFTISILACCTLPALTVTTTNIALVKGIRLHNTEQVSEAIKEHGEAAVTSRMEMGVTPLHLAAALNEPDIIDILLKNGADIDAKTDGGFTPLHWAAGKDAVDAAEELIKYQADINAATPQGITPLHWAANNNSTNVVKLLLAAGAEPLPRTRGGATPLLWAVSRRANNAAVAIAYQAVSEEYNPDNTATNMKPIIPELPPPSETNNYQQYSVGPTLSVRIGLNEILRFVKINKLDIWMGAYEISNAQYRKFKPDHNSLFYESFTLNNDNQPVVYVSWSNANDFCTWLNDNYSDVIPLGTEFRLPTTEEWEIAAHCGDNRIYPWGSSWPPPAGNLPDFTARKMFGRKNGIRLYDDGYAVTCPVTRTAGNKWGIHGLIGNVREWCEDWYDKKHLYKIRHGGCWDIDNSISLRIDTRGFDRPDAKYDTIGFRIVVSPLAK